MGIFLGTQEIYPSGIEKVYVGTQLVYQKEEPINNYTELTVSTAGSYTLNIYKQDTQPTKIYINNVLVATSKTQGSQDIPITTTAANSVIKVANAGNWYFDDSCLGDNRYLTSINTSNESKMTQIGVNSFSFAYNLTSITIPSGVTYIAPYAFNYCTGLTSISISDSVTTMLFNGLEYSSNLASYIVDSNNTTYKSDSGNRAILSKDGTILYKYANGSGTTYTIPLGVTTLNTDSFFRATSLTSVTISSGVVTIGNNAFMSCTELLNIDISDTVTEILSYAFNSCRKLTSLTIPNSVNYIGENAFSDCTNFTTLNIYPRLTTNKITTAGNSWVNGCDSTKLTIHSLKILDATTSQTAFGTYWNYISSSTKATTIYDLLENQTALTVSTAGTYTLNIYKNDTQPTKIYVNNVLTATTTTAGSQDISVTTTSANSVIAIQSDGNWYFDSYALGSSANNAYLSAVDFTDESKMTQIGISAFFKCSNLTSITIPSSVTSIGDSALGSCTSLTSITIPSSVTSVGIYAFSSCTNLASVTIPTSVTTIGTNAFSNDTNLKTLDIGKGSLFTRTLFPYVENLTIQTEGISASLLTDDTTIKSVTINAGTIGTTAFDGCSNLTSLSLGSGVTSIGKQAFRSTGITSLTIPSSVTDIAANAFSRTSSLSVANFYNQSSSTKITSAANSWFYSGNSGMKLHTLSSFNATTAQNAYGSKWNYRTLTAKYTVYYDL